MGNDIAMLHSNFERQELNFYPTPSEVTQALIPFLFQQPFNLNSGCPIWEPACGNGAMSEVLRRYFPNTIPTDLNNYGYGYPGLNFYECKMPYSSVIITNPPYGKDAEKFIKHALFLTKPFNGIVCMLLRKEFDSAVTRNDLFNNESPFCMKIDLLFRPVWFPEDERQEANPRHNFSWFCWNWQYKGMPFLQYADKEGRKVKKRK